MRSELIPLDAVRDIEIMKYDTEGRKLQNDVEVSIHFKEDHEFTEENVSNNVWMFKTSIFNAEEIRQALVDLEDGDEDE